MTCKSDEMHLRKMDLMIKLFGKYSIFSLLRDSECIMGC